ncbi:hypothetical protein EIP86_008221 [Pleurotus ostreatoroseus]|nr:hypothetical protein EIP86_008221 [Pleurotus ostreatoroseus]
MDRMLAKSLSTPSDVIIYDLEDSVPPSVRDKDSARSRLGDFLRVRYRRHIGTDELPSPDKIAVRVNSIGTPFFNEDLLQALQADAVRTLILPKIHSAQDLNVVSRQIYSHLQSTSASVSHQRAKPLQLVASIESAAALYHIGEIAGWQSEFGPLLGGKLTALLVNVVQAYTYSTKVCVNYKDLDYLKDECSDGRRLGFTGKACIEEAWQFNSTHSFLLQQAIHPSQVEIIQNTFVPSEKGNLIFSRPSLLSLTYRSEILRAARILHQMELAHKEQRGAAGLATEDGGKEMIDAPMIKQVPSFMT